MLQDLTSTWYKLQLATQKGTPQHLVQAAVGPILFCIVPYCCLSSKTHRSGHIEFGTSTSRKSKKI
jgi:hypothetical protein